MKNQQTEKETINVRFNQHWGQQNPAKEGLPLAKIPVSATVETVSKAFAKKSMVDGDGKSYGLFFQDRDELLEPDKTIAETSLKEFSETGEEPVITLVPKLEAAG